jgi:serine/threonine protein kinase
MSSHFISIQIIMIQFAKILNQGISSAVFHCVHPLTNQTFAAKVYHQNQDNLQIFLNEVHWLSTFEHPGIIQMKDYFIQNDQKIIFLEMCKFDLFEYIELNGAIKVQEIKNKMKPIFEAIKFVHQNKAAHCDIKIENICVMENGDFKLIDFGSCSSIKEQQNNYFGSFLYYPPELLSETKDIQKCDIWSLGVTLYTCATGQFPFDGNDSEYFNQVIHGEPNFSILEYAEEYKEFLSLMKGMLNKFPNNRFSIEDCLSHPFFSK